MDSWLCSRCQVKVDDVDDIEIFYGEIDLPPASGYRCPVCKAEFIDGTLVVYELNPAEEMLEGK